MGDERWEQLRKLRLHDAEWIDHENDLILLTKMVATKKVKCLLLLHSTKRLIAFRIKQIGNYSEVDLSLESDVSDVLDSAGCDGVN